MTTNDEDRSFAHAEDRRGEILSDVLRSMRLKGAVYFQADFSAPWGMEIPQGAFANFHVVADGTCVVSSSDGDATLNEGDIAVFPHGASHALLADANVTPDPAEHVLAALEPQGETLRYGAGPMTTRLICGHFEFQRDFLHPLFSRLPERIVLRKRDETLLRSTTELVLAEARRKAGGSPAVVDRLAEVLLLQVLRAHANQAGEQGALGAGADDPQVVDALQQLHRAPTRRWTAAELAQAVGGSRSAFAQRFSAALGMGPMQYLTTWRMHLARELLHGGDRSLVEVATTVGYESEFAFARAFKRVCGEPPGAFRKRVS